ncbi:MAG: anaerobic glycerol-3-phosphate dehydrogenase subunit A [Candidatus Dormibacteraeota bacterium]|nr:anaerobic glycerol-3-phosphate dehydrogenase subunit A [Candidatus Dormibacteraeota bacterium]
MTERFDVLVVGGGATGCGLARDLAMRGARTLLVEQGDLCHGTSGRFHGLLHSGARYVTRDPRAAGECIRENRVLRRIAAGCVEDTGGLFAWLGDDPDGYPRELLDGCRAAGIECEELPVATARREEPLLNPAVQRVFRVPDAAVQSFDLAEANVRAAVAEGGEVRLRTRLTGLVIEQGRVVAAELTDRHGSARQVEIGCLANATGIWAGTVARLAGDDIAMAPGWGVMVIMNQRLCRQVVNRCRPPGDADIVVPVGTVCIAGTTDRTVDMLEDYPITRQEVREVIDGTAALIPAVDEARVLRVFAGARPIYDPAAAGGGDPARFLSRSHTVIDHAEHGVENLVSIVGGKLTTYRLMAQDTADVVARKLGLTGACRTAQEPLPGSERGRSWALGDRLEWNEGPARGGADTDLVCECELVTRSMLESFFDEHPRAPLDDALRSLRLGMGPCQACFCALRAAGIREVGGPEGDHGLVALRDFLEERMRGNRSILWGDQARQHRLTEIVYREVLAVDA